VADFSSIEGVVLAWLAGEQWVIDEYAGDKLLYEACAAQMFGVDKLSVKKGGETAHLRQKGKVATLSCGYQGSVGALKAFGADKMGMSEEDMIDTVTKWREANPNIVKLWYGLDNAAIKCVKTKAPQVDPQSNTRFTYEGGILRMWLPSGRSICYYNAEIGKNRFGKPCVTYMGIDQFKKKWTRIETSGGKLAENLTQAVARDCLRDSMLALEDKGFQVVMHCHDEVICEEPITGRQVDKMVEIMTRPIPWAEGLHLRAEGFETLFYKKDD
jgi:DNA polymerase